RESPPNLIRHGLKNAVTVEVDVERQAVSLHWESTSARGLAVNGECTCYCNGSTQDVAARAGQSRSATSVLDLPAEHIDRRLGRREASLGVLDAVGANRVRGAHVRRLLHQ